MENSSSSGKKIVFKKRLLTAQPVVEELPVQPEIAVLEEEEVQADDRSIYYYQGEIFDQFHRPLSAIGAEARLGDLALELLAPPKLSPRPSVEERQAEGVEHQEIAEALAAQVYDLAQRVRESDLDVYLSAFNVVLADRSCWEAKDILDRTNEIFTERYYAPIRERGERPEIFHQIVKRVGHESAERIGKIVRGLDVADVARELWDLYNGAHSDKGARITDALLDCTERQVRALREEFLLIPYKDLARQLHEAVHSSASEAPTEVRRTIGKSEVYEQKKQSAFRSRDKLRIVRYLLLGRSSAELELIKRFYQDLGDPELPEGEVSLETHLRRVLVQSDFDKLGSLLNGWTPHTEAEEIHQILFPASLQGELDDVLSDPRDAADRDHTQGIGPFLRRFRKRRMLKSRKGVHDRVMNSYELIAERVAALSAERFLRTNEALAELYGYDLDPTLFPSLALFDARRTAIVMKERIEFSFDLHEIFKPMEFLTPRQCLATQKAFECLYGETLRVVVEKRLAALKVKTLAKELAEQLDRYIYGQARWPLNIDLLARYRGDEPQPGVWDYDFRPNADDEQAAIALAEIIDQDTDRGELDRVVRETLIERSYDTLNRIERAFYDLTDPHLPFRDALQDCLSEELFVVIDLLLGGLDLNEVVNRIHDEPALLATFSDQPSAFVSVIARSFEKTFFISLDQYLINCFTDPDLEERLVEALAVASMSEAQQFRKTIELLRKDVPADAESLKELWAGPIVKIMGFERAFDVQFPRLRVHLKYAAARMALPIPVFADLILTLEGIDPEITGRIQECFDAVDILGLQEILRNHKDQQRTIEECFDLINPDTPMRRAIKEMKVDLDLINETLLYLEGFLAREVAAEIHELSQALDGEALGEACSAVLAPPSAARPNPRIPVDINWMDEMVYQISLAYQRQYGLEFIAVLRGKEVPAETLEELTGRVFGHEVCVSARELFNLLKGNKEGRPVPDYAEEKMCTYLESRGSRHRDRLLRAYNAYWAHTPGFGSLLDDVTKFFKGTNAKKKMLSLLIGAAAERKQVVSDPVRVH